MGFGQTEDEKGRGCHGRYRTEWVLVDISRVGIDLIGLGLTESPAIGEVLSRLRLMKLEGKVDGRDDEMRVARQLIVAANRSA